MGGTEMIESGRRADMLNGDGKDGQNTEMIVTQIYGDIIDEENNAHVDAVLKAAAEQKSVYVDKEDPDVLLLRPPRVPEDFRKCVEGLKYRQEGQVAIEHKTKAEWGESIYKNNNVDYYFNNRIKSMQDIKEFIDHVRRSEHGKRFKIHTDLGMVKEILKEDGTYEYKEFLPLEQNLERLIPIIIHDDASANKYKEYLQSHMLKYQSLNLQSTKELIIAFHSLMVVVYRMPVSGGRVEPWVKKHCVQRMVKCVDAPNNLCFWMCMFLSPKGGKKARDLCT
jgi:hypothetical protein